MEVLLLMMVIMTVIMIISLLWIKMIHNRHINRLDRWQVTYVSQKKTCGVYCHSKTFVANCMLHYRNPSLEVAPTSFSRSKNYTTVVTCLQF